MPNVSNLVQKKKKTDYDAEITDIEKNFTTSNYNKFMNDILDAKITNKKLMRQILLKK